MANANTAASSASSLSSQGAEQVEDRSSAMSNATAMDASTADSGAPNSEAPTGATSSGAATAPASPSPAAAAPVSTPAAAAAMPPMPPAAPVQGTPPAAASPAAPVAPPSAPPAAAPQVTEPRPVVFGTRDPNARAQRIARALVSDIVAYHPKKRAESLAKGTMRQDFKEEIMKSWEEYVAQVGTELAKSTPFFRNALNDILAAGQQVF
jgi:hypothetical protein